MIESGPAAPRRAALLFIFITVALDMLALGMIAPLLPKLIAEFAHGNTQRAAEWVGLFGTTWATMQLLCSPVLGALSDRFGRRPVVLLSNLGLGLDYILMALSPSLSWLFAGRVIAGITSASVGTAGAYIADVTPPERRAASFGLLGGAFGIGFVLGPAIGGALGSINLRLPFWVAAGLSLANALYGLLLLPESLPPERRAPFRWRKASPFGALGLLRSHTELRQLSLVALLSGIAHEALPNVFVLYAGYRYHWDQLVIGMTLAVVGVCSVLVQGGVTRPMVARFGERRALLFGLVFGSAGFCVLGLASTGPEFWCGIPLMAMWGVSGPAAQAMMSHRVAVSEQGQLQGATRSLRSIGGLVGPGLFSLTFARFIEPSGPHAPGAPFLLAAAVLVTALVIAFGLERTEVEPAPRRELS